MARRYALRDDQWENIKDMLPGRDETVGVTAKDNRLFVESVLYRYQAGIPWRDLPERFVDFRVIHTRWSKRGVWQRVFERLAEDSTTNTPCLIPRLSAPTSTVRGQKEGSDGRMHRALKRRIDHKKSRHL